MSANSTAFLTPQQYLEIERQAQFKSEYYRGKMFAMVGAKEGHNLIAGNVLAAFHQQFRTRPCRVYPSDMRVDATGLYTYPDVVAVCGEPRFLDERRDTLLNPTLVVEVLSPSTEAYARGRKSEHYRSIESLQEYLLISADRIRVDLYTRQTDGRWLLTSADRLEDSLSLESIGCRLGIAAVYEKVDLSPGTLQ